MYFLKEIFIFFWSKKNEIVLCCQYYKLLNFRPIYWRKILDYSIFSTYKNKSCVISSFVKIFRYPVTSCRGRKIHPQVNTAWRYEKFRTHYFRILEEFSPVNTHMTFSICLFYLFNVLLYGRVRRSEERSPAGFATAPGERRTLNRLARTWN